jgi:hypothetical protein
MWYFVRYRWSSCFSRRQGKSLQVWFYLGFTCGQAEIVQCLLHAQFAEEHPPHRLFSRRNAEQMAQSMPQGAMRVVLKELFAAIHGIMP